MDFPQQPDLFGVVHVEAQHVKSGARVKHGPVAFTVTDVLALSADWVSRDPRIMGGEPCIRGTRVPVECITSLFPEPDEWIHECYPHVPLEAIRWLHANHKEES